MHIITETKTVYSYEKLSEKAKRQALQEHAENLDCFWSDATIEDVKEIAALMGWEIEKIYYSGFWSQGDGACFTGRMRYSKGCANAVKKYAPKDVELHRIAKAWQDLQRKNFYSLRAEVSRSGMYYHEYCTEFNCEDIRENHGYLENAETEKEIIEIARDFMRWIYKQLENAYEYETSEENFAELCEANEYTFLECGKMYNV